MKETGIIMSGNHPRLILEGLKTMTRRVITPHNSEVGEGQVDWSKFDWAGKEIYKYPLSSGIKSERQAPLPFVDGKPETGQYLHVPWNWAENATIFRIYPRYEVGDRLWVKETWASENRYNNLKPSEIPQTAKIFYLADGGYSPFEMGKVRSPLFMPRWASRILLEITEVRAERLQEITEEDALAEGITIMQGTHQTIAHNPNTGKLELVGEPEPYTARYHYEALWDSLNAKKGYGWGVNPWVWVISFKMVSR